MSPSARLTVPTGFSSTLTPSEASTKPFAPGWILGLRLPGRTSGSQPLSSSRPVETKTSACWIAFIRLGLAGTKCGSSNPRQRLWADTCFPPTNWATEARSVNDVATLRSACADAVASRPNINANMQRISDFMESSRVMYFTCSCLSQCTSRRFSVGVSRVVTDRVAQLKQDPVVGRVDAAVRLAVAVLESHKRELRGRPRDVGGAPGHLAGNLSARFVDQEVREAVAGLLAADACPPDLRQAILERRVPAVLLPVVGPVHGRALLDVFTLQNPPAPVRVLRRHVADREVRAHGGVPVVVAPAA